MDPLTGEYPFYSPYHFAGNTPIQAVDLDGLEPEMSVRPNQSGKLVITIERYNELGTNTAAGESPYIYQNYYDAQGNIVGQDVSLPVVEIVYEKNKPWWNFTQELGGGPVSNMVFGFDMHSPAGEKITNGVKNAALAASAIALGLPVTGIGTAVLLAPALDDAAGGLVEIGEGVLGYNSYQKGGDYRPIAAIFRSAGNHLFDSEKAGEALYNTGRFGIGLASGLSAAGKMTNYLESAKRTSKDLNDVVKSGVGVGYDLLQESYGKGNVGGFVNSFEK